MMSLWRHSSRVRGLNVELPTPAGRIRPVSDVSLRLDESETLGLVGESGSGKTMLALALIGLEPHGARRGATLLLISHSVPVVAQLATRVAVMHAGKFVEIGIAEQVLRDPAHPYTRSLLAAVPQIPA